MPSIDELPVILGHNSEIFIARIDAHHIFHRIRVRLGQSSVSMPVSDDVYVHKIVHQARQFNIIFKHARRILKRIVVVVCSILLPEFFKKLPKRQVNSLRTFSKISKSIICLPLCVNYLISSLLNQVCFILPQVVRFLQSAIAPKNAWSIQLDIVVIKSFRCNCLVITLWDLVIIGHIPVPRCFCQELVHVFVA